MMKRKIITVLGHILLQDRALQAPQMGMARRKIIICMHACMQLNTDNIKQLIQVSMHHFTTSSHA